MHGPPTDLSEAELCTALLPGCRIEPSSIAYAPVGFGSHHWIIVESATHGQPKINNILITRNGPVMIDWDTIRLAPAGTRPLDHRRTSAIRPTHRTAGFFRTVQLLPVALGSGRFVQLRLVVLQPTRSPA